MKKIGIGLLLLVGVLAGAALFVTRDTGPTHPALQSADLPPLIPTRAFFADPRAAYHFIASPDGKYVSYTQASLTGRSIVVQEIATGEQIGRFPIGLEYIRWHPTKPLMRFIYQGNDWEADPRKPARENWKQISPRTLSGGWIKNEIATNDSMPVLTWGKTTTRGQGHMWLVSQDGLNAEKVADGTDKSRFWIFDKENRPVLRLDSLDAATDQLLRKTEGGWRVLTDIDLDDIFQPISRVRADGTALARSSRGRDRAAIVSFDVDTARETVLVQNADADVGWETRLTHGQDADVVRLGTDTLERVALTERGQVFLDILAEFPQPISLGVTTPTASGRYVTQALSIRSQSYIFLLIDLEEKSYITLSEYHMRAYKDALVVEQAVRFDARDGLGIPAILTRPKGVRGPAPFVVHIHGGPAGQSNLGYDHFAQLLANRGYGVLSVNFRGSTGFGKAFQARGFKEFGRAMQDDITDAARWLIEEELADPAALVAMGTSYGGYSAALAMTRDPGLFKAAIVEFPMLDVEFQSRYHPGFWSNGINAWWRYFGQIENAADLELMRSYSPINRVDDLRGPLLMLGGMRDQITAVQQVKDFEAKAVAAGKDVRVHYFADAGHGVSHWRDQLRRARLIEDFLAQQIGGRSGGFEFAERAPEFID